MTGVLALDIFEHRDDVCGGPHHFITRVFVVALERVEGPTLVKRSRFVWYLEGHGVLPHHVHHTGGCLTRSTNDVTVLFG